MKRWILVGYYHNAGLPWGTYKGGETALEVVLDTLQHISKKWPANRQVTICSAICGGVIHSFRLPMKSDDKSTWPRKAGLSRTQHEEVLKRMAVWRRA